MRLFAYVFIISILSLVLESVSQTLGQALILPIALPVGLMAWLFNSAAVTSSWLDVDSVPFAAFLLRGTVSGIFWGGCVLYPLSVYRRTKLKPYKHFAIAFSVYAFIVLVLSAIFFLMLANSGWTD